jgi:UDP-2-acetamido-3-amino-2,3-dideoxy-glucuronate N-acetyltransferase
MSQSVGVIGCGYWGKNLVRNFHQLGALAAICDSDPRRLQTLSTQFPGVKTCLSPIELYSDPGITAVAIATPAETHYELSKEALLAGRDVFVEKPLALTCEDGESIVNLAERTGRLLMVGHLLEYHFAILKLAEVVKRGDLGDILYVYSNRLNLGKVRREENILWSFAPHDVSVLLMLLREMPTEVRATGGNYLQKNVADVTITNLTFPSGARAHIFVSWLHPYKEHKLVVIGSNKMAVFDDTATQGKLRVYDKGIDWVDGQPIARATAETTLFYQEGEPLRNECQHFLEAIRTGAQPRTDGHNGLRVLRVLEASQKSLENGGMVVKLEVPGREVAVGY